MKNKGISTNMPTSLIERLQSMYGHGANTQACLVAFEEKGLIDDAEARLERERYRYWLIGMHYLEKFECESPGSGLRLFEFFRPEIKNAFMEDDIETLYRLYGNNK